MIPISVVRLGEEEEELVLQVLRSGRLAQGPMVERLEASFAIAQGVKHVVAVNNGTTALVAALQALQLDPGDEVITTAFSFVATLNAILESGASARFADVGEDFNLDPASVESLIGPRTRVIMPVHLYGQPADMTRLSEIADKYGLAIVEDAAQAHGARHEERGVGSFGIGCFSLYATKNIMSGEGGLITTNDAQIADRLRLLRNQGMRTRYNYEMAGHNYRMTEMQAAVAIPQVARLDEIVSRRQENARRLSSYLKDASDVKLPPTPSTGDRHVYHQYTIRVSPSSKVSRDELSLQLEARDVSSGVFYPRLMHDYPCYTGNPRVIVDDTPNAASMASEVLSLPIHQHLAHDDVHLVAVAVDDALR